MLSFNQDWTAEQKKAFIDVDKLHLKEPGHRELGAQVAWAVKGTLGADPCGTCPAQAPPAVGERAPLHGTWGGGPEAVRRRGGAGP